MATPTPHDALFRRILSDPRLAAEVIQSALPPEVAACIDFGSLELLSGSFIDDDLRATQSDLVFSATIAGREARLFVLVEHQSSPDPLMPFRLLRYAVRVWDQYLVEHPGATKLPVIVPLVIHQGPGAWRAPTNLAEMLDLAEHERATLGRYAPRWHFELDDLGTSTDASLRGRGLGPGATLALAALRDVRDAPDVLALVARWSALARDAAATESGLRAFATVLQYILQVHRGLDVQDLAALANSIIHGAGAPLMATAHQLIQQGMEQGIEQGMERGILAGRRQTLRRQLQLRFGSLPEAVVARLDTADAATLDRWEGRVLVATSLDDALETP